MEWTDADKAMVGEIVGAVTEKVMLQHVKYCPHAIKMKNVIIAILFTCLGSSIGTGSVVWYIAKTLLG